MNTITVAIHPSATRTPHPYQPEALQGWVIENKDKWTPGDQPGIFHCSIPKEWVRGEILKLIPGVTYESVTTFKPREGVDEDPRVETRIIGVADPVLAADVIIFSHELLKTQASSEADFEIVAIRGLAEKPNPRPLMTLLANIFGATGGTATGKTDTENMASIRESYDFWNNHVMVVR
jgi:hypothetical protein